MADNLNKPTTTKQREKRYLKTHNMNNNKQLGNKSISINFIFSFYLFLIPQRRKKEKKATTTK